MLENDLKDGWFYFVYDVLKEKVTVCKYVDGRFYFIGIEYNLTFDQLRKTGWTIQCECCPPST